MSLRGLIWVRRYQRRLKDTITTQEKMMLSTNVIGKATNNLRADKKRHAVVIPATYDPPNDRLAKMANWLVKETALYPERSELNHWIPLSREYGRVLFGGRWHQVIKAAEQTGLLERHHSYWDGSQGGESFPKAVRLAAQYRTGQVGIYDLARKPQQSAKLKAYRMSNLGEVGQWLSSRLTMFALPSNIQPRNYWDAYVLAQIRSDNHYAKRCDYGRYHTLYTVLGNQHREKLTSEAPLSAIDVRQMQPTLLDALIHSTKNDSTVWLCGTTSNIYENLLPIARQCQPYIEYRNSRHRTVRTVRHRTVRTVKYRTQCEHHDPSTWMRDDVKKNLLKALFAPNNIMVRQPAYQALMQLYPEHAKFIYDYKRSDHKRLACTLQKMESSLIIDGVCGWLMTHYPDIPLLTIHDELIVPTSLVDVVTARLTIEFSRHQITPDFNIVPLVA